MQYYKKLLEVFDNNVAFYIGCLMWASYIKTQPKQKILSNHCFGKECNPEENTAETDFMIQFTELFPKDMKYYLAKDYSFDGKVVALLKTYREFLVLNEGFVKSEFNTDIILPENVITENAESYKDNIESVLKTENLSGLLEYLPTIIRG